MAKKRIKIVKRKSPAKSKKKSPSFLAPILKILLAIIVPVVIFSMPSNWQWIQARAIPYYKDMKRQSSNMDLDSRKRERHGVTFQIADYVCKNVPKDSWFLMPPQAFYLDRIYASGNATNVQEIYRYISHINIFAFHCMDLKLLDMTMNREELSKAQYTLDVKPNGSMSIVPISSPQVLEEVLQRFSYEYEMAMSPSAAVTIVNELKSKK